MSSLPLSQVKFSFLLATIAEGGFLPVKVLCGPKTSPEVSSGCCSPAVCRWSPVCSPVVTANTYLWWQLVNVRERRWTGKGERDGGEEVREGQGRATKAGHNWQTHEKYPLMRIGEAQGMWWDGGVRVGRWGYDSYIGGAREEERGRQTGNDTCDVFGSAWETWDLIELSFRNVEPKARVFSLT